MAFSLKNTVTLGLWAFLLAAFAYTCFGCKGYMQDDNTFVVTFGTSLTFKSIGPKDVDRRGEVGIDFQDWVKKPIAEYFIDTDGDGVLDQSGEVTNGTPSDPADSGDGDTGPDLPKWRVRRSGGKCRALGSDDAATC